MTSPNFPTPFIRNFLSSKGRGRNKPYGKTGGLPRPGSPHAPSRVCPRQVSKTLIYRRQLETSTSIPPQLRPFPFVTEGRTALPFFLLVFCLVSPAGQSHHPAFSKSVL